jgi:choice-of-anchor C domain-containing protein
MKNTQSLCLALSGLGLLALSFSANAQNIVLNPSFETPVEPANSFGSFSAGSTALTSWTVASGSIDHIGAGFWQAADGVQSVDMNGTDAGSIFQDLATTPGSSYNLSFSLAGNPAGGPTIKHLQVFWNGTSQGIFTFDTTGKSFGNMGYVSDALNGLSATGATTRLQFTSTDAGSNAGPALDNVSVVKATVTATPEPGSLAFFTVSGLSGAGLLLRKRRRK